MLNLSPVTRRGTLSTSDAPFFICLLGEFRLWKQKTPIPLRGSKSETLIALLALHKSVGMTRDAVLHALWPNVTLGQACQSLNSLVYALNKLVVGDHSTLLISHLDSQYQLNVGLDLGVDIDAFENLIDSGDRAQSRDPAGAVRAYAAAIELYRGDLCISNDVYALLERERLRARYLSVLVRLAENAFQNDQYAECLTFAHRLVLGDPCREDAHRLIMRCYVRQHMRAQALRQYSVCAGILQTEFEAAPEPETTELYDRIRRHPETI